MNDHPTLLDDVARRLDVRAGDVDRVKARARARDRRRHRGVAVLTSVSLLAGAGLAVLRIGEPGGEGAPVAVVGAAAVRGDVPMRWEKIDPASGLGMARDVAFDGVLAAPLYALSTAPGEADVGKAWPSRVVWRSDDGVEWTPSSTLDSGTYVSDLASTETRVFAVGTAPATAVAGRKVSPPVLGWSDDGARTWTRADVDLSVATIAAGSSTMTVAGSDLATGPAGTLAVITISSTLDVASRLPVGVNAPHGWAITADGVDVLGPVPDQPCPDGMSTEKGVPQGDSPSSAERADVPCFRDGEFIRTVPVQEVQGVRASYPWAALGVSGDLLRAVRRQPFVFFAPPGSTEFSRIDPPAVDPVADVLVQARPDGFDVAAMSLESGVTVLETDGATWTSATAPGGIQWVQALGRLDGRVAMVGSTATGSAIVRADASGGWQTTDLTSAVDPALTADGARAFVTAAGIGPLGAVVSVSLVSEGNGGDEVRHRLLVTRDGITWSDDAVDELAGRRTRGATRVLVAGDRTIVTVRVATDPKADRHEQVVLLGAPA